MYIIIYELFHDLSYTENRYAHKTICYKHTILHTFCKFGYVPAKYLHKYAFEKMIELEIPESIADFIKRRVPKRIGAKHYTALARQANNFYPRYIEYVEKASLKVSA